MVDLANKILKSIDKFSLNLTNKIILTEAATGNYVVTPIIIACSGAKKVYAFTKASKYGSIEEVKRQTYELAKYLDVESKIEIITDLSNVPLKSIDVLTNTGFLRPINKEIIDQLSPNCVIPLMWETWEFRDSDLDLEVCIEKGIKVYGTNEDNEKLKTKEYIGYMVLNFLLDLKHTPLSSKVLVLGCDYFTVYTEQVLKNNCYYYKIISDYNDKINIDNYDCIVLLEHHKQDLLIGRKGAFIDINTINEHVDVIHICGNVDFSNAKFNFIPKYPASFGYMSYTVDYMGKQVVTDLHTAGLKVSEGMMKANKMNLEKKEYKIFMEKNYPAMSFKDERYW
ncbi:hypothetical protein [Sulfurimonas paralvinellae]|uniref:Uncharacterized protein n=1 Tax=Sulfurimonas paralvinellae TaxID=317658 RepID=A0A7M1B7X1_9BACT|nr:hypothetical protein [Sulfurimonas paralvinellae]QOP45839.1 hypothetical protein FM071_05865 [Sulfurimonas paralvinellae]